jgi:CubicO group peptidase (beta-lactamase class C family)
LGKLKGKNKVDLQKKVQDVLDLAVENERECGCQAVLFIEGELAANAFAGYTDWTKTKKVDQDTIFPVYSTGKAPSSTVLHRLVEKGLINYDTYIGDVWPEFACNGKEKTRLWHILSYRAGLFEVPELEYPEQEADWEYMMSRMAKMKPAYPPGTRQQYHGWTYGWLTGGIACHVLGENDYFKIFRDEVGIPAGMNRFYYGTDKEAEKNSAKLVSALSGANYGQNLIDRMNSPVFRNCCNPSSCTMTNALSAARHYAALDSGKLLSPETIAEATKSWRGEDDPMPLKKGRWELFGLGYVLSGPPENVGKIFGHGGVGGSEALLDKERHYALAITRNVFANPNVLTDFYDAIDFKNRDWPDTAEVPD